MNIAVYLGAKSGDDPIYSQAVIELGKWIAGNGHDLVYGGSDIGLMGDLSNAVKDNGGRLIGVGVKVAKILAAKHHNLDEYEEAETVQERKEIMMKRSDAFITIPGSLGTLDEVTDIMAASKLGLSRKPCLIYNIKHYYDPLISMLDNMVNEGFLSRQEIENVHFVSNLEEIIDYLK